MSNYQFDRMFTNFVHQNLALEQIYKKLCWERLSLKTELAEHLDIRKGIDYCFKTESGNIVTVQERFREQKYQPYNDITFRYRRDKNQDSTRVESEFFKIIADFMVYGVIDTTKNNYSSAKNFLKFAVINLDILMDEFDNKNILVRETSGHKCFLENNVLICPINYNRDGSSSFVPVDISLLMKTNIASSVIELQHGYI